MRGCGAFVIKLSVVGGLSRAARLCRLAKLAGAKPVISSAFESGVGLAHASILASVFCVQGVNVRAQIYTGVGLHVAFNFAPLP